MVQVQIEIYEIFERRGTFEEGCPLIGNAHTFHSSDIKVLR